MNRLRFLGLAAVCLIGPASMVWSAPVPAARSGLEQIPDTAPLVIHVRGVQGTRERFMALMAVALPDVKKKYQEAIDSFFENGPDNVLKGRKLSGLAKDGPLFFALLDLPKPGDSGEPKMAFILTVSNYKEFRENILTKEENQNVKDEGNGIESASIDNKPTYFVNRKGYAIVTLDKDVAESFTKKITGLHSKLSKELAAKLLSSDVGIYVNMEAVNKEYGEQIKQARQAIEQALAFGAAAGDESQKKYTEMIKNAIPHVFQTLDDMQSLLLTLELRTGGLALHLQSEVKENSPTANYLQDTRPIAFKELERLPRDRAYYLGMKISASLYKNLGGLIAALPTGETKDTEKLMEELAKAGPGIHLSSGSFPPAGLDVYHYDDPAKAVAATLKMFQNMDTEAAKLKEKPVVKTDAEKFGDFKLHSVQLTFDLDKLAEQAAAKGGDEAKKQLVEAMKNILGEKKTVWFGTDGKKFVQITAADWKAASKLLEQYSKGISTAGEVKAFRDARKELPANTSFLILVDAVRLFARIFEAIRPMVPAGQLPPGWPNLSGKGASSYLGLAATLQPQRGGLDLFLTTAAIQEFYKVVIGPLVSE
jgi:hypothetical protein